MFNENLRKILVTLLSRTYQNSVYFASVLDKITIDLAEFLNVELGIYPDKSLLYRMVINEIAQSAALGGNYRRKARPCFAELPPKSTEDMSSPSHPGRSITACILAT
jgi:hypothetical protein